MQTLVKPYFCEYSSLFLFCNLLGEFRKRNKADGGMRYLPDKIVPWGLQAN